MRSEAEQKFAAVLEAVARSGSGAVVAATPATVRWLLCGRRRPVSASAPEST